MKKVFVVSLLLVSIFLIGNAEFAFAYVCSHYRDYECTWTNRWYGEVQETGTDCMELCYDNGFEVSINDYAGYNEVHGYLYPAPDNKHLLGTVCNYD